MQAARERQESVKPAWPGDDGAPPALSSPAAHAPGAPAGADVRFDLVNWICVITNF